MANSIVWQIADNIKSTLGAITTYPNNSTPTVEFERMFMEINGRYPYIMICGPWRENEDQITRVVDSSITFVIKCYCKADDDNETVNGEKPYLTRNVSKDIINALMVDVTRGELAQKTEAKGRGYAYDMFDDGTLDFYVYVELKIQSRIDAFNPTLVG